MDQEDKKRMEHAEALNNFEKFVYLAKDGLSQNAIIEVSLEADRNSLLEDLKTANDWIYEDGDSAPVKEIKDKLAALQKRYDPMLKRQQERAQRPDAIKALQQSMTSAKKWHEEKLKELEKHEAKNAKEAEKAKGEEKDETTDKKEEKTVPEPHYTRTELERLAKQIQDTQTWLDEQTKLQEKKALHEDPVFTASDLAMKKMLVETELFMLQRKPKPKVIKPKKTKTSTTTAASSEPTSDSSPKSESTTSSETPTPEPHRDEGDL